MYLSTVSKPSTSDAPDAQSAASGRRRWAAVGGNVVALGMVSLVTDISSEMITAILPLYLMVGLHLTPLAFGVVDGIYTGATALLRLVGGYVADRIQRRKAVAAFGYGLSSLCKLGLLAAGASATAIGAVITLDRAGKGLRTAPRDALITLSAPAASLGRAFGVHRAMDSMGAFAGPLVALAVLSTASQAFDAVFVTSFCIAAIGVLILVLFVRDRTATLPNTEKVSPLAVGGLLRTASVRRLVIAACLLGLSMIGDGFIYLLLQKRVGLAIGWFPILAVGTSLVYLLLAAPVGALADRVGKLPALLGGYAALIAVYLLLYAPIDGWLLIVCVLLPHGAFYAATDGVLMALAGPVLPERLRTTGIALLQSGQSLAYLASSVAFGLLWQTWGPASATRAAALISLTAMAASAFLLKTRPTADSHDTTPSEARA